MANVWNPNITLGGWYNIYPELDRRAGRKYCCLRRCGVRPIVTKHYVGVEWEGCSVCGELGYSYFYLKPSEFRRMFFDIDRSDLDFIYTQNEEPKKSNVTYILPKQESD